MNDKKVKKKLKKAWKESPTQNTKSIKEASWSKFQAKTFPSKRRAIKPWRYAVAAILLILISGSGMYLYNKTFNDKLYNVENVIENPTLERKTIILPDSSKVELSANSKLVYATNFTKNRKIELKGEGFFEVKKDKKHPFQVVCNETTTTVLGTSFIVKEDSKNTVSVELYEGSIQMNVKDSTQNWILSPGEKFIYDKNRLLVEAFNRFKDFDDEKLTAVVKYIEESYGYQVSIPEAYLDKRITLRINKKEDLPTVIKSISKLYNLNYEINEELKQITFR